MIKSISNKWKIVPITDVVKWASGGTPKSGIKEYYDNGTIPWLIIGDLNDGIVNKAQTYITEKGLENSSAKIVPKGRLLVAMYGSIGKLGITGIECCTNQAIAFVKEQKDISTKFLFYYMMHIKPYLIKMGKGGTQKNISQTVLKKIKIPVPEINEQEYVVSRIEELFSELDNGVGNLKKAKIQLDVYKKAVISESYPELSDEVSRKLMDIADISSGITKGRKLDKYDTIKLPYLRVANVQNGYLDLSEMKDIELKVSEKEKFLLHYGDVLYTEGGDRDKLGRGTVWKNEIPECVHQNHVFKARIKDNVALPKYISYWSMSKYARNYFFRKGKQSVNLASINKTVLSNLEIPIISISEQENVVKNIEEKLSACENIEKTIDTALQQAETMRQSILKQAFEGKL